MERAHKMAYHTKLLSILCVILFTVVTFLYPHDAAPAVNAIPAPDLSVFNPGTYTCEAPVDYDGHYTQLIIECIEPTIKNAVLNPTSGLLTRISSFMSGLLPAVITLAIALFGVRVISGEQNIAPIGFGLMIRIGVVLMLSAGFGGYAGSMFDILDELVSLTTPDGFTPWTHIDAFIGKLLGFTTCTLPPVVVCTTSSLKDGIIALLAGSFFAKNLGVMVTLVGGFAIFVLFKFIFNAVYLYLSSVLAIGFLLIISPMVIPFFVFTYTEHFLIKWFRLLVSTMLTPMLMFAILPIFLSPQPAKPAIPASPPFAPVPATPASEGIFKDIINEIFTIVPPDYLKECVRQDQPLTSSWLIPTDKTVRDAVACVGKPNLCPEIDKFTSALQIFNNANLSNAFNYSAFNFPVIDCGEGDTNPSTAIIENDFYIKYQVFSKLFTMVIFALLLNSMLGIIPTIASNIAQGTTVGAARMSSSLAGIASKLSTGK